MIPLVVTSIAVIATITVGAILGFMMDGTELAMTSKEITEVQNLKGAENINMLINDSGIIIHNNGGISSHIVALKTTDSVGGEQVQAYKTILNPADSVIVSGNYSGKNVYAVTSLGNVFTAEENSIHYTVPTGSVGTHMSIIQMDTKGSIITGNGNQIGVERTVRPYSASYQTDDYAFVLDKLDSTKVIDIPTFDGWYYYNGQLEKNNLAPNILRYTSVSYTDSNHIGYNNQHLVIYGGGKSLIKLDPHLANKTLRISGTIQKGSIIEISGSPDSLSAPVQTVLRVSAVPENIAVWSNNVVNLSAAFDKNVITYATVKSDQNEINFDFKTLSYRTLESINIDLTHANDRSVDLCVYVNTDGETFEKLGKYKINHNMDELIIGYEGIFQYLKIKNCYGSSYIPQLYIREITTAFGPNKPDVSMGVFGDKTYYETTVTIPYSANIAVINNDAFASVQIKGETPTPKSPYFKITGLTPNMPYRIERNGFTSAVSITDSVGSILQPVVDVDFGTDDVTGGILRMYPYSAGYVGEFDALMIDAINGKAIHIPPSVDGKLIYVPHAYVRWTLPVTTTVENVVVNQLVIPYLNANYKAGSAVMIPIMPGAKEIRATMDGVNVTIQLAHIATATQIVPIDENTASISQYGSNNSAVSVIAEASTSVFVTAPYAGKMYAITNINGIAGGAVFTMDSNYTGDLEKARGSYTRIFPVRSSISIGYNYYFPPPESISNINNLATKHTNQLVAALNRGQISTLVTEVDVYKNFKHEKTERVYKASAGIASIVSDISHATYDTISFSPSLYYDNGGFSKFNTIHQVRLEYQPATAGFVTEVDVDAGDMVEFVVRVGLDAHGTPAPEINQYNSGVHATSSTSAYVHATIRFDGGSIIVGMS